MAVAAPLAIGASVLGAGVTAAGQVYAGQAAKTAADYNAQIAMMNKQIALQDAVYAYQVGASQLEEAGFKTAAQVGAVRTAFGAGNIGLGSGTPARVQASTLQQGQLAEGLTAANTAKQVYGFQVQAASDAAQANLYQLQGTAAATAADIGAAGTILGGVGSVATKFMQFGQSFGGTPFGGFGGTPAAATSTFGVAPSGGFNVGPGAGLGG